MDKQDAAPCGYYYFLDKNVSVWTNRCSIHRTVIFFMIKILVNSPADAENKNCSDWTSTRGTHHAVITFK